jgi:cytochrome bd-type quinol oxidase subunit 2
VFLLSAIGAILSVMTNRLGRVVDRARALEAIPVKHGGLDSLVVGELDALAHRARLISRSITLCTTTALLICAVIVVLFLGAFVNIDTSKAVAWIFIAAMTAFFVALLTFLREISIAATSTRIGLKRASVAARDQMPAK